MLEINADCKTFRPRRSSPVIKCYVTDEDLMVGGSVLQSALLNGCIVLLPVSLKNPLPVSSRVAVGRSHMSQ